MPKKINVFFFVAMSLIMGLISIGYVTSQANVSLSVNIEPAYLIVSAGDLVVIQVNLIQLGDQARRDVVASLSLVDSSGKVIPISTETIALETKASFITKLNIPKEANTGAYNVDVELFGVNGKDLLAKASRQIVIEKTAITHAEIYLMGFFLSVVNLFLLTVVFYKKNKNLSSKPKIAKSDIEEYLRQRESGS